MMKDKKLVLIFSLTAIVFFSALVGGAAWRQGWFMPRETFKVRFEDASGLSDGTPIFLMGLRVGNVDGIELVDNGEIEVTLRVLGRYAERLYADATANAERTFIIGERVIKLNPGSKDLGKLAPGSYIPGKMSLELVDLLSGGKIAAYFETFNLVMEQLKLLVEAAGGESGNIQDLYKQMFVALKSVEKLSYDVRVMRKDVIATEDTKVLVQNLAQSSAHLSKVMTEMNTLLPTMNNMSGDVQQVLPDLADALKESVTTLQAMQRSFFLRSGVKEIQKEREEERKARNTASSESKD